MYIFFFFFISKTGEFRLACTDREACLEFVGIDVVIGKVFVTSIRKRDENLGTFGTSLRSWDVSKKKKEREIEKKLEDESWKCSRDSYLTSYFSFVRERIEAS